MSHISDKPDYLDLIKNSGEPAVEPPKLLKHIQKSAIIGCERLAAQMFSSTDDLFYDLSKRASSNNEANLYFEGMREIRIKKEGVTASFLQAIMGTFAKAIKLGKPTKDLKSDSLNASGLSIVEGDDLEIDLARSNMVSRTRATYKQEIYELSMRLDHLLLQVNIDEDNNPIAPDAIVDAFIKAVQEKLEIDIKALLILFKLFEKHVLKQLGHIYAEANQILIDAGILPVVPKYLDRKAAMEMPQTSLDDIPTLDNTVGSNSPDESAGYDMGNQPMSSMPPSFPGMPQMPGSQAGFANPAGYPGASHGNLQNNAFQMDYQSINSLLSTAREIYQARMGSLPPGMAGSGSQANIPPLPPGASWADRMAHLQSTLDNANARSKAGQGGLPQGNGQQAINIGRGLNCYLFTNNPGPQMPAPELDSLLTTAQPKTYQELAANTPRNIIAERVNDLLSLKNPEEPQSLQQTDEDIINLVAMFFDQVLADNDIPAAIQSLICRLQIPVLRVALQDRNFFDNPEHPARRLINAITIIGINFDESKPAEKDAVYQKTVEVVQLINSEFKSDISIFTKAEETLNQAVEKEKQKAWAVEQRTKQTEAGKSRMKQARIAAQSTIYKKLKTVELPEIVNEFLTRNWLQVMVITHLKHGAGTSEWVSADQAVSDLIWLCKDHKDIRSQQRRARLQPELMERLESGLEAAIDSAEIRRSKINLLDETISSILDKKITETEFKSLNEEQKDTLGRGEQDDKPWEEMTAIERQQSRYQKLTTEFYDKAKNLNEGTWVHYFNPKQNKHLRCKLSAKMDGDTYIFVNRFGLKVLEKARKQFAYDLQFGRAKILDNRPIFDRMMLRIVSDLGKPAAPKPA